MELSRRDFLRLAGATAGAVASSSLLGPVGCESCRMKELRQKVVVLGFDGASPHLLESWAASGLLPNVKRLMSLGGYRRLGTTNPPESPVAWASFAVGGNPGRTGIFDFLRRDPQTYCPQIATSRATRPRFLWGLIPISPPGAVSCRRGRTFWKTASENKIRTVILEAPVSFEPEELEGGYILSGLGVPDLRGTQGTYHYFSTGLKNDEVADTEMGGKLVQLQFDGDVAKAWVQGPWDPLLEQEKEELKRQLEKLEDRIERSSENAGRLASLKSERAELVKAQEALESRQPVLLAPISFRRDGGDGLVIEVCGRSIRLTEGQWSDFTPIKFRVTPIASANGIARFLLASLSPQTSVYMTPINIDPTDPVLRLSFPRDFSRQLAEQIGLFKTQGWAIDTMAYNEDRLSDEAFLEDVTHTFEARHRMLLYALKNLPYNLFFMLFSEMDRVQHMFWRTLDKHHALFDPELASKLGNPVLEAYRRMDGVIGEVLGMIGPDTTLIILSDHGFHPFRTGLNLNTWLCESGYMRLFGRGGKERDLEGLFGQGDFWPNVDWQRTRAYALGLGQIYINLKGREGRGIVQPGPEYQRLKKEIIQKLSGLRDPRTGAVAVRAVYSRDDIYWGAAFDEAPDLVAGMASGYRVSWQSTLGGITPHVFSPNDRKWSGDHCSLDFAINQGVLLCNRPIRTKEPSILDIAPTALSILGVALPAQTDGAVLLLG